MYKKKHKADLTGKHIIDSKQKNVTVVTRKAELCQPQNLNEQI